MSLAGAAGVFVTATVRDLVVGSGLEFDDVSAHELRGVPGTWQIFAVSAVDGHPIAPPLEAREAAARLSAAPEPGPGRRRGRRLVIGGAAAATVVALALVLTSVVWGGATVTLIRVYPANGRVETSLHDGAFSEHLWGVLEANGGSLWQATPHELVRRNMQTGRIEGTIPLPMGLGAATGGAGSVFVTPERKETPTLVTRFDATSGRQLGRLRVDDEVADMRFGDDALWVLGEDGALIKIDPLTFRVLATYQTHAPTPGDVVPLAGYVWICECGSGRVVQFDPASERVVRTLPLAERGFLFGVDDTNGETHVWLLDPGASTLTPIDPTTGAEGRSIGVPEQISDAEIARGSIWVSSPAEIRQIDLSTSHSYPPIVMPPDVSAGSIAVDPQTGVVWVANCGCPKQQS
jgi:streptogramin lyase